MAALAAVAAFAGCTMCPDPYDYSGPVPNGSAPQNDFRARSGGILPLGAAACPWPPLVGVSSSAVDEIARAGVGGSLRQATFQEPTLADPPPDEPGLVDRSVLAEPTSVLVVHGEADDSAAETAAPDAPSGSPLVVTVDVAEPESSEPTQADARTAEPSGVPVVAPLAETPGWRTRR